MIKENKAVFPPTSPSDNMPAGNSWKEIPCRKGGHNIHGGKGGMGREGKVREGREAEEGRS